MFSSKSLDEALHTLNPREEACLRERFGLDGGKEKTLEECGIIFNVARETIRQIEAKALRMLRHPSRSKQFGPMSITEIKESEFITDEERAKITDIENELWNSNLIFNNKFDINFDNKELYIISELSDIYQKLQDRKKQSKAQDEAQNEKQQIEKAREKAIELIERTVEEQFRSRELKARIKSGDIILDDIDISELRFSTRSDNALRRAGINTLKDLLYRRTHYGLDKIRNLGQRSKEEINYKLEEYGMIQSEEDLTTGEPKKIEEDESLEDVLKAKSEAKAKAMRQFDDEINVIPIEKINLSVRCYNSLKRAGIQTLGDLKNLTYSDLDKIKGLNKKSINEIISNLEMYGFTIKSKSELEELRDEKAELDVQKKHIDDQIAQAKALSDEYDKLIGDDKLNIDDETPDFKGE